MCCSGLTCARALSAPGWWRNKFYRCYCNVLGSQNAHPLTETYISRTLFVLRVIYNKPYYTWVVRFKLNRSPSACRTVCGEPCGSIFFSMNRATPIYVCVCVCMYIYISIFYYIILSFFLFFLSFYSFNQHFIFKLIHLYIDIFFIYIKSLYLLILFYIICLFFIFIYLFIYNNLFSLFSFMFNESPMIII